MKIEQSAQKMFQSATAIWATIIIVSFFCYGSVSKLIRRIFRLSTKQEMIRTNQDIWAFGTFKSIWIKANNHKWIWERTKKIPNATHLQRSHTIERNNNEAMNTKMNFFTDDSAPTKLFRHVKPFYIWKKYSLYSLRRLSINVISFDSFLFFFIRFFYYTDNSKRLFEEWEATIRTSELHE